MTSRRVDSYDPKATLPPISSRWIWESDLPHARCRVAVMQVRWNGEEWWVQTTSGGNDGAWNDLSRFWEAVVPDEDHL